MKLIIISLMSMLSSTPSKRVDDLVSWIQWGVNAKSSLKICSITKMATFLLACLSTHCSKYFPKSANKIRNVIISFYQGIFIFHGFFWTKINTSLWDEGQKLNVFVRRISKPDFSMYFLMLNWMEPSEVYVSVRPLLTYCGPADF